MGKSKSERIGTISEIKGGLSGKKRWNEKRQRCEGGGEGSQLQTTAEINMTEPALCCRIRSATDGVSSYRKRN